MAHRPSDALEALSPYRSEEGGCVPWSNGEGRTDGQCIGEFSVVEDLGPRSPIWENTSKNIHRPSCGSMPHHASIQEAEARASGVQGQLRLQR